MHRTNQSSPAIQSLRPFQFTLASDESQFNTKYEIYLFSSLTLQQSKLCMCFTFGSGYDRIETFTMFFPLSLFRSFSLLFDIQFTAFIYFFSLKKYGMRRQHNEIISIRIKFLGLLSAHRINKNRTTKFTKHCQSGKSVSLFFVCDSPLKKTESLCFFSHFSLERVVVEKTIISFFL